MKKEILVHIIKNENCDGIDCFKHSCPGCIGAEGEGNCRYMILDVKGLCYLPRVMDISIGDR